ncbi:hypothetical protein DMC30DRAFT_412895 [Rhodotorula diobovata]|uniref:Uncharacterized protein n=1 Tax=Rhodotorula diobovata TaxID=5288 RepID=A0A5C5G8C1_9BASI|nr:hypothetical protein DMC30DRAFT_412895 [Rhodotorula diobovata]
MAGEVKRRMVDLEPTSYKYLFQVSASGAAGRAFLSTYWDPTTTSACGTTTQDSVAVTILAVAIRILY